MIYFDDNIDDINYLFLLFSMKKAVLIKNSDIYNDYLVNSRNTYLFNDYSNLEMKLNKVINGRVSNLTNDAYDLIKNNTFSKISVKFKEYLG